LHAKLDPSLGPVGYLELLRTNSNFRYLWLGQVVSLLGDWFNLIASAALVATLTESGFAVGGLFMVRMLAPFVTSPIAGVVADRYSRKHILILTDIIRAVTVLGFLFVRDAGLVWLLYVLTAVQLGTSGFFFTTRNAILPDVVDERALGTANAITSATWSVMLAIGAALGGIIAGFVGIYPAFVIDAATFLVSAVFLFQIRLDSAPTGSRTKLTVGAAFGEYVDGLRYMARQFDILMISTHKAALMLFFGTTFQVVQVTIAEKVFVLGEGGSLGVGILFASIGIGTGISPLIARRFTGDRSEWLRRTILLGYALGAMGLLVAGLLANLQTVILGTLVVGLGNGLLWVFSTQLLLRLAPGPIRGRVFASEFALFSLASAAGAAIAGWGLDSSLGIRGVLWLMAALSVIPAGAWGLWLVLGRYVEQEPNPSAAE
jgi:MFS family permease